MQETKTRHHSLLTHYQRWLNGITRLAILNGMCHPNIQASHHLMIASLYYPTIGQVNAVVPQSLYRLIYQQPSPPSISIATDLNISLETETTLLLRHPMLEGILLSECIRLKQRSLANKLISLFQQFSSPEYRYKLVWLCWYDLMLGAPLEDWQENLKRKTPGELGIWLNKRQDENALLTHMMDEYLLFIGE
ncbi:hypothetical protein LF934_18150 [Dickeya dadantii]|uniref:hypothetical protein n=1 Tax=Dickeya dadantii TaxID=204038 RepID=UPI001CF4FFBF|nr:hypothetical protein [Dickeya dadantii]MCA7014559.1 hypothetical protein [Dickeya dadantii]